MIGKKEIPPPVLPEYQGMHLYHGFISGDGEGNEYRFRSYVPTTVYDAKVAILRMYQLEQSSEQLPNVPERLLAEERVNLVSLPQWNVGYQALVLSTRDERKVRQTLGKLEKKVLRDGGV